MLTRPWLATGVGIPGVGITGRRGVTRRHKPIDQIFVLDGEFVLEGAQVFLPLLHRPGPCQNRGDELIVEHPVERKLARRHATLFGVFLDRLGHFQ